MSKEDDYTVYADLDGDGHNWEYTSDKGLSCIYRGTTAKVEDVEGFSEDDAPEWPEREDIGLEKF